MPHDCHNAHDPGLPHYGGVVADDLRVELRKHLAEPFPDSIEKGRDYGQVEPVLIGADVYGWALRASRGEPLTAVDRERLQDAADDLRRSLSSFPVEARPYYERILRIAELALAAAAPGS